MSDPAPSHSAALPPYRALLAVDTEKFSRNPSARLPGLGARLPQVLQEAMTRSGLDHVWRDRRFDQSTGDGYVLGTEPEHLPFLVHPLLDNLHEVLVEHDRQLRAEDRGLRLRLRVSLHVGPVPDAQDPLHDRVSTPTNETFRLLDAVPVRQALETSHPDVTLMAAVVSQRVYEDVVLARYSGLHPERFDPITAESPAKDFTQPAWLYVPRTSRRPDRPAGDAPPAPVEDPPRGRVGPTTNVHGDVGQSVNAERISGGIHYSGGRRRDDRGGTRSR
jgi:hypothetical protein